MNVCVRVNADHPTIGMGCRIVCSRTVHHRSRRERFASTKARNRAKKKMAKENRIEKRENGKIDGRTEDSAMQRREKMRGRDEKDITPLASRYIHKLSRK